MGIRTLLGLILLALSTSFAPVDSVALAAEPKAEPSKTEATRVPCLYAAKATETDPAPEFTSHADCAAFDEASGRFLLEPAHVRALDFYEAADGEDGDARDEDRLATVLIEGRWHYVKPSGRTLEVLTFDNGPDSWSHGLVRSRQEGKIVYVGRDFEPAFPARYDWGWPFAEGRALMCNGCRAAATDGEHREILGGVWGYVDTDGREVVPVELSRDEAMVLRQP